MRPWIDTPRTDAAGVGADMVTTSDFCCILDHALREREAGQGRLTERLGLPGAEIAALSAKWLRGVPLPDTDLPAPSPDPAEHALRTLILMRAGSAAPEARWLAAILARRAQEPRHLWRDLGLPSRAALSGMIARHLPGLAAANAGGMRWKKFLYRQICADPAVAMCLAPSCDACDERSACFAPD